MAQRMSAIAYEQKSKMPLNTQEQVAKICQEESAKIDLSSE